MGSSVNSIPSRNVPFVDAQGRINPIWYEYFRSFIFGTIEQDDEDAEAEAELTVGAGLSGGGNLNEDISIELEAGSGINVNANGINVDIAGQSPVNVALSDEVLVSDASANSAIGKTTVREIVNLVEAGQQYSPDLEVDNVIVGDGAGESLTSGGESNTFIGKDAGKNCTSRDFNVAVGWKALDAITSLSSVTSSVAVGAEALGNQTSSDANTAVGYHAGLGATSGSHVVAVGTNALQQTNATNTVAIGSACLNGSLTTVQDQTVVGYQAGSRGSRNVHVGYRAGGGSNTTSRDDQVGVGYDAVFWRTGDGNVGVGKEAGKGSNTAGDNNTFLGTSTGASATTGSNNTIIGYNADSSTNSVSNEFTLGNASISTLRCQQTSITALSDRRDKQDIEDIPLGLSFINALKPVKFTWNMRDKGKVGDKEAGFIAQDLQEVSKEYDADWVGLVLDTNPEKLEASPGKLIPIIVKAIQELYDYNKKRGRNFEDDTACHK